MRKMKSLVALVLTGVLCLGMTAFAAEETNKTTAAYITKDLKIAAGTTTPDATFTFNFAADAANSVGLQDGETAPAIEEKTVTYSAAVTDAGEDGVISLTTGNVLDGVAFDHAGVYAYTVSEAATGFENTDTEEMTYAANTYTMLVFVVNGDNGPEIDNVIVKTNDGDGKLSNLTDNGKEEANGGDESVADNGEGKTNDFRFVNTYTKTAGKDDGDNDDTNGKYNSIILSNATVGDYADKTKQFEFTLKVEASANETATEYKYVVTKDGVAETKTAAFGAEVTFTLNDGDTVAVKDLVAGAAYTVTEKGAEDYTAAAVVDTVEFKGEEATDLTANGKVTEDGSNAAYTNTYDDADVPATGIIINNLPYVMLIAVAAAGLFAFMVSGRRREQDN